MPQIHRLNIKPILENRKTDLWDELSDFQKSCVMEAREELKQGKGVPHKTVMKKYKKLYLRK